MGQRLFIYLFQWEGKTSSSPKITSHENTTCEASAKSKDRTSIGGVHKIERSDCSSSAFFRQCIRTLVCCMENMFGKTYHIPKCKSTCDIYF